MEIHPYMIDFFKTASIQLVSSIFGEGGRGYEWCMALYCDVG